MIRDTKDLRLKIREYKLDRLEDKLVALAKPSIFMALAPTDDALIAIGSSKLGGNPDLPPNFEWKHCKGKPLTFIGQFRLSELAIYDIESILPPEGILHYFVDMWGDHDQPDGWHVLFTAGEQTPLIRTPQPDVNWKNGRIQALPSHSIEFIGGLTLPNLSFNATAYGIVFEEDKGQYGLPSELYAYLTMIDAEFPMPCHYFLGHSQPIQYSIEDYMPGWQFLFQIDTDNSLEVMWGDVGTLYVCIPKSSLEKKRFEDSLTLLQEN